MDTSWGGALRPSHGSFTEGPRPSGSVWRSSIANPSGVMPPSNRGDIAPESEQLLAAVQDVLQKVLRETLQAERAALREELESCVRCALGEELLTLRLDLVQRQQQTQQRQLQEHLDSVAKLMGVSAPTASEQPSPSSSGKVVRSRARHHTWHNRSCAADAGTTGTAYSDRKALLRLPAESLRKVVKATQQARSQGVDPISPFRELIALSPESAAAAAAASISGARREEEPGTPPVNSHGTSSPPCEGPLDSEVRSELRSEEDQQWKQNWKRQMRARLSSQLGDMSHTGITRSVSKFFGAESSVRHRTSRSDHQFIKVQPKSGIERVVDSAAFHLACGAAIVANAIFIGILTDISARHSAMVPPVGDPEWFVTVNQIFAAIYVAEVVLRVVAKRWDFVLGPDWKWNVFDFGLAAYSLTEELLSGFSLTYARLLRGFRMVRVLRVIRVMRLFRELRLMVCSIIQSLVSLSWALLLLLLIMYLFTILFMHAATQYLHEGGLPEVRELLIEWYGSVGKTMYSLLLAISGGIDWSDIVVPLHEISLWYQVLFCFYVLFVIIGVLNVLTSAFVQRACELSRLDRDLVIQSEMVSNESFLADMKGIFEEVDTEGTGCIDWPQFHAFIHNEQVQAYFATQQLDTSDARELFNLLDQDGDGEVCIEEFILGCKKLRGQAKSSDVATLMRENKKASTKTLRAMRKLEAQLCAIYGGFQGMGIELPHVQSWMGSPSSCYARSSGSVRSRSRSRTPAAQRRSHTEEFGLDMEKSPLARL